MKITPERMLELAEYSDKVANHQTRAARGVACTSQPKSS